MTKQYTLTLLVNEPRELNQIESDDLIHLLTQFHFILYNIVKKETVRKYVDDDIPF